MSRASFDQIIEQELLSSSATIVTDHLAPTCRQRIVGHLLLTIDLNAAAPDASWPRLDDPAFRTTLLQGIFATTGLSDCARSIADRFEAPLNAAVSAAGYHGVKPSRLLRFVEPALKKILASAQAGPAFQANPFPVAWPEFGNAIAMALFADLTGGLSLNEWAVLNRLVLASFFISCVLPTANQTVVALAELRKSVLSVRGSLVRLPEKISAAGSTDVHPAATVLSNPVSFAHRSLSSLLQSCHDEAQLLAGFGGIAHRVLDVNANVSAAYQAELRRRFPGRDPVQLMRDSRRLRYQEYNFTILAYMALCCIEQLLHTRAEHLKIPHVGPNGWLFEATELVDQIGLSAPLAARIRALNSTNDANIRNRVMHGGLLEIEGQRTQNAYRSLTLVAGPNSEPYSSENICNVCLTLLSDLDAEIASVGLLSAADLGWVSGKGLGASDIALVGSFPDPRTWTEAAAEEWRSELFRFLTEFCPAANMSAKLGFHGWLRHYHAADSFVQILFLSMTFETLYRSTLHLVGHEVLQQSSNRPRTLYVFRYHVMDDRPQGLCTPDALNKLVRSLLPQGRNLAIDCFKLAIRLRDAFAHGAVPSFTTAELDTVGHVFVYAMDLLRLAALDHLTQEAAYYQWINGGRLTGKEEADWAGGRDEIGRLFGALTYVNNL